MPDHGVFYWNELLTRDVAAAKAFYTDVLGWETEEMPMPNGTYTIVKNANGPVGGIMDLAMTMAPDRPSHWFAYIAVDDVDAAAARTEKAGGKILAPAFDVPEVGRIAIVEDPSGAPVGIMTPAPQG